MSLNPPGKAKELVDVEKVQDFFNEVELSEEGLQDLELLVEAEARGLLDPVTLAVLDEARARGFLAKRTQSLSLAEKPVYFDVKLISMRPKLQFSGNQHQFSAQITQILKDAVVQVSLTAGSKLELRLDGVGIHLSRVAPEEDIDVKPRGNQVTPVDVAAARAVAKAKSSQAANEGPQILLEKPYALVRGVMTAEKHIALIFSREINDSLKEVDAYVLRCVDKRRATEVEHKLQQHLDALTSMRAAQSTDKEFAVRRITLTRGPDGFGFSFVGATDSNVSFDAKGVFINFVNPAGPSANTELTEGLQILSLDGINTKSATISEIRTLLQHVGKQLVIEARENPAGYAVYERKLGRNRPELRFVASAGAVHITTEDEPDGSEEESSSDQPLRRNTFQDFVPVTLKQSLTINAPASPRRSPAEMLGSTPPPQVESPGAGTVVAQRPADAQSLWPTWAGSQRAPAAVQASSTRSLWGSSANSAGATRAGEEAEVFGHVAEAADHAAGSDHEENDLESALDDLMGDLMVFSAGAPKNPLYLDDDDDDGTVPAPVSPQSVVTQSSATAAPQNIRRF